MATRQLLKCGKTRKKHEIILKLHWKKNDINRYSIAEALIGKEAIGYVLNPKTKDISFDLEKSFSTPDTEMLRMFSKGDSFEEMENIYNEEFK